MAAGASLQINLAPPDVEYAEHVIRHQLRVWAGQVAEIILTLDLHRSRGRQFGRQWVAARPRMLRLLDEVAREWPSARVDEVDYGARARTEVAERFFGGHPAPVKDFRGGPYYSYFFALCRASQRRVLHLDSDMMFGGGSNLWLVEALDALRDHSELLCVNPLPGPPTERGELREGAGDLPERIGPHIHRFHHMSTRIYLMDLERLASRICPLSPERLPGSRARLGGLRTRRGSHDLPEAVLSRAMRRAGMSRLDMLGTAPGMWTVHPVSHDAEYLRALPSLLARIEQGKVTRAQLGRYNLDASMLS